MEWNVLHQGDCVTHLKSVAPGTIDLAFADPPFNIGYDYDVYRDRQGEDEYLAWTRRWGEQVVRVLKPAGAFWLAIGDEFAAELIDARGAGVPVRSNSFVKFGDATLVAQVEVR